MEKYLVTSALPYANGHLHVGHIAGAYLPADIFVRFLKLKKKKVIYICGTDEHGAPISIQADHDNVEPIEIVEKYHKSIKKSFQDLEINFDNFSGTARKPHFELSQKFFKELLEKEFITTKTTKQFYCEHDKRFLADRYVEGICPHCNEDGARGDQCDACGKLLDSVDLKEPKCKLCNETPILKTTKNWYLELPKFEKPLLEWLDTKDYWKENVINFIKSFIEGGLIHRAITRDINWGIPVPVEGAEEKVLYVWFEAPIGYISSTVEWAEKKGNPDLWKEYWQDENTKLIHFIGKDNIPFHTVIWPSLLMQQDEKYILPYDVPANEYLNLEGKKISTSKNWAVWVNDFTEKFDSEYLRFYLASNAPENRDSDFSWKNFQNDINLNLANVMGNFANRVISFSFKYFDGNISKPEKLSDLAQETISKVEKLSAKIHDSYENYKVRKATRYAIDIAREGNKYFDFSKPWKSIKEDKAIAEESLYISSEILRRLSIVLSPILPSHMRKLRKLLNLETEEFWSDLSSKVDAYNFEIKPKPLFKKIEDEEIEREIKKLEENSKKKEVPKLEHKKDIAFDDFLKMEMRVAKILKCEKVKKSNKLLKVLAEVGNEKINVVAGISKHYKPKDLIGKKVAMLLNLPERKIFGEKSQGMILAAEDENGNLSVLVPDKNFNSGSEIS